MVLSDDILLVWNPHAGRARRNKGLNDEAERLAALLGGARIIRSSNPLETRDEVCRAASLGLRRVISAGGDGTHRQVVEGLMRATTPKGSHLPVLGLVPLGSGNDFVRGLGLPVELEESFSRLAHSTESRRVDLGQCHSKDGRHYFLNVADVGLGAPTVRHAARYKILGGTLAYLMGSLHALATTPHFSVRLHVDGQRLGDFDCRSIILANGSHFGGGMRIAPHARVDDGRLDVIVIGALGLGRLLYNLPRLYRGTIAQHPDCMVLKAREVTIEALGDSPVPLQFDGESQGTLPARFSILGDMLSVTT